MRYSSDRGYQGILRMTGLPLHHFHLGTRTNPDHEQESSDETMTSHVDPRHWISSCVGPFLCVPTKSTLTRLTSRSDRPGGAVCMLSFAAWMTLPSWSQFCYGLVGSLLRSGAPLSRFDTLWIHSYIQPKSSISLIQETVVSFLVNMISFDQGRPPES
ncbi:hypothetical protein NN561_012175 [Cricetulus griseus]